VCRANVIGSATLVLDGAGVLVAEADAAGVGVGVGASMASGWLARADVSEAR
jgi:hypothetical protein